MQYQISLTREIFRVHTDREGIGSTHQGILGTYTTNFGVNNTSSKVEHGSQSRGYNLPKALCIRGRTQGFENMQERSDNNPPNDLVDRQESDVSIYVQPEEEIMQRHQIMGITN